MSVSCSCINMVYRLIDEIASKILSTPATERSISVKALGREEDIVVYPELAEPKEIVEGWWGVEAGEDSGLIPIAARYNVDDEFEVHVMTRVVKVFKTWKVRGCEWVPLAYSNRFVVVPSGNTLLLYPKPQAIMVLKIEPSGRTIVMR